VVRIANRNIPTGKATLIERTQFYFAVKQAIWRVILSLLILLMRIGTLPYRCYV